MPASIRVTGAELIFSTAPDGLHVRLRHGATPVELLLGAGDGLRIAATILAGLGFEIDAVQMRGRISEITLWGDMEKALALHLALDAAVMDGEAAE